MPRRRRPPPIPDPLLPLGPQTLRARARKDVLSQTRPQIRELGRQLTAEAAAGTRNIAGVTRELAGSLGGYEQRVGDIYGAARQQLGAINTEAANRLAASGQQGADALRSSLAAAGLPTQGAEAIAATGRGAAAAGFGTGAAELAQLVSNEASGRQTAAALPGIARLGGLQGVRELQARKQEALSKGVRAIQAKVPGLVSGEMKDLRSREYEKAVALRGFGVDVAKLRAEAAQNRADIAARAREQRLNRQSRARLQTQKIRADIAESRREYQNDLALAREKFAQSSQDREDRQAFENAQRRAKQRFQDRQNRLSRAAYGTKGKKKKKAKPGGGTGDKNTGTSPSGLG
jgi:hypothetical protein